MINTINSVIKSIVMLIILLIIIKCFSSVKSTINGVGRGISEKASEFEVSDVLKEINSNNVFKQQSRTKSLGDKLAKISTKKLTAEREYNLAMKNDPPWYLEWKDGILWWDKKLTTKKEYDKQNVKYKDALVEYRNQVANDSVLADSKKQNSSINSIPDGVKLIIILTIILLMFNIFNSVNNARRGNDMQMGNGDKPINLIGHNQNLGETVTVEHNIDNNEENTDILNSGEVDDDYKMKCTEQSAVDTRSLNL